MGFMIQKPEISTGRCGHCVFDSANNMQQILMGSTNITPAVEKDVKTNNDQCTGSDSLTMSCTCFTGVYAVIDLYGQCAQVTLSSGPRFIEQPDISALNLTQELDVSGVTLPISSLGE